MQSIRNFKSLFDFLSSGRGSARKVVAVACPHDNSTVEAVESALRMGFADFILIGSSEKFAQCGFAAELQDRVQFIEEPDSDAAARKAVALVRDGLSHVLMKGLLNTDNLLRAVLDKQNGLLPQGAVLTHITAAQIPAYDKLLLFSDAAVIPFPTLPQRIAMVKALAETARALGTENPKIALIHCSEKSSPKFPITTDYAELRQLAKDGAFGSAVIDGPMDVKTACDPHSGDVKGIESGIAGQADALLMPDIEAGNVFYKTISCFGGALNAGMLAGTTAPVVLPSRADSPDSKLASLALAIACAH